MTADPLTPHPPGAFVWIDLRTDDLAAAKRFYAGLFGWSYAREDYVVASLGGEAVAGAKLLAEGQAAGGHSPFWLTYVATSDADAAARRTRELGGTVLAEPFTRGEGQLTVIADPIGGKLCLWESRGIGACRVTEPGCLTRSELHTSDALTAIRFYTALFGWRIEPVGTGDRLWTIDHDGTGHQPHGGIRELTGDSREPVSRWIPYFGVRALSESLDTVVAAGGRTLAGPVHSGARAQAVVRDPQGAEFGLVESLPGG